MLAPSLQQTIKERIGKAAAEHVESGMLIGLGSGSTATCFIESLAQRCQEEGLKIRAVSSSQKSARLAQNRGIPVIDISTVKEIDLTIDGADEIDAKKQMIKGGGGALLREKIVAMMSKQVVIIVDESKLVRHLGAFGLPVEIVAFGHLATEHKLSRLGYKGRWRLKDNGDLYVTDNGNTLFDVQFEHLSQNLEEDHLKIRSVVGVVETGFFPGIARRVIVGFGDGQIRVHEDLSFIGGL